MHDLPETPGAYSSTSSREEMLLRKIADHYCDMYFLQTLEGFVHNLNGPLQILWVRSEQLEQDIGRLQQDLQEAHVTKATELSDRMQQRIGSFLRGLDELNTSLSFLTKDLLGKQHAQMGEVKINEVIRDTLSLLDADMFFKHRVEKTLRLDEGLPNLRGRSRDLCTIVLGLIQNASEAMVNTEAKQLIVETSQEGDHIIIRIQDSGCGIPEEHRPHIYKAGFTTKRRTEHEGKDKEHAGLGLAVVSALLKECQGNMTFESLPGMTTFTVQLPLRT
ncbi:MAG: ATP-binding protein [Deltaproteobacteria bacterium]|jgi:signal transduction histidine kinase